MVTNDTKNIAKVTKKAILDDLCNVIDKRKAECAKTDEPLLYGYISTQVRGIDVVYPSITHHDVNNKLHRCAKRAIAQSSNTAIIPPDKGNMVQTSVKLWLLSIKAKVVGIVGQCKIKGKLVNWF